MEPIPVFFEMVDRTALVLKPRQPFYDWLKSIEPDNNEPEKLDNEEGPMVYLLPDFDEMKDVEKWLKKNFDMIFTDQLNNWYTDETIWVQNRTFKLFKEWFSYSLHTMVYDTLEEPIEKI